MSTPSVSYRLHTASRAGESPDASDDAACVEVDEMPARAAVTDGATESVYAGLWAQRLAKHLVLEEASADGFAAAVDASRSAWRTAVDAASADRPWYVTAKVEEGAFATGLGLSVQADGQWRAVAAGDCCLMQLRDGALHRAWPMSDPEAFTHRPTLVGSRPGGEMPTPETATGTWAAGDRFLLATDAVAAWLLRTDPAGAVAWTDDTFAEAVSTARDEGTLRNDDATLLVLEMSTEEDDSERAQ